VGELVFSVGEFVLQGRYLTITGIKQAKWSASTVESIEFGYTSFVATAFECCSQPSVERLACYFVAN